MESDAFEIARLGDVVTFVNGDRGSNYPKGADYRDEGIPFISAVDIANGSLDLRGAKKIAPEAYAKLRNGKIKRGDLLFCLRGSIGKSAMVRGDHLGAIASSLVIIRGTERAGTKFIQYLLSSPFGQSLALRLNNGSVQPNISVRDMKGLEFRLPPLARQEQIVEFMGAIDDRIDNLRQTNATLEAIAQALFKSWFVDFDPVRAKAGGREPEGMDAATAALFPSEYEESELGLVPKGWRVSGSDELLEIVGGGTPKTSVDEYWGGNVPWFSVVDAPASGQVFTLDTAKRITEVGLQNCSAKQLPPMTTIISARGTVGKVAVTGVPMAMNQSCYALRPKAKGGEAFIYFSTLRFVEQLQRIAHGAVFDTITRDSFKRVMTCVPSDQTIVAFGAMTSPLLDRIRINGLQAASLATLRDTLLPRLISGKLRLPEAEALVDEAIV